MSAHGQPIADIVGAGAAICSTSSFVPQLIKILRERKAEAVSMRMYLLTVSAFVLWTAYGVMLGSWPLLASNLISLGLSAAILVLTLVYQRRRAPERPGAPRQAGSPPAPPPPSAQAPDDAAAPRPDP
jgi:MtN3 and saliva related transmembrane protein